MAASLLFAAAMLGGCSTNPATGRSQFIILPADQVAAMGAQAAPQMLEEMGGEVAEPAVRDYVERVGRAIADQVEPDYGHIEWKFFVLDSDVVNAFALPGGNVFISMGLLRRFDNEAQVAGVLGHEIGHVTGRHVDERLSQTMAAELGMVVLGSTAESELITLGAQVLSQGVLLKFNRDQESESDFQGLKYMAKAGYDPHGMFEVLKVLAEAAEGPRPPEILSTHPDPARRMREVGEQLKGPYAYTQGNPQYKKHADRFQREIGSYLR